MKVLIIYPHLTGKGGTETVLAKVLTASDESFNFSLFLPGGCSDQRWMQAFADRVTLHSKTNSFTRFWDTLVFILKTQPNIVISMSKVQILAAWMARKIFRRKFKLGSWNHFSLLETRFPSMLKLFKLCDYHLAISSGIQHQLQGLGISPNRIFLVYNPIDPQEKLIPRTNGHTKEFVYIGRLQSKSQKNLTELISILGATTAYPWHLRVIGAGDDDDEATLKRQAKDAGIAERITWLGWQSQPWDILDEDEVDLLFLTSKFEGLPMVLAEAMSYGVPCFSADCPTGPEDIIKDGANGTLYTPGNVTQAHEKLVDFFEKKTTYLSPEEVKMTITKMYTQQYLATLKQLLIDIQ